MPFTIIKLRYLTVSLIILVSVCCNSKNRNTEEINEGIIKYQIEFFEDERSNPLIALLPSEMVLHFKNNNSRIKIDGYLGLFSFSYIADYQKSKNYTLLRILDKTYNYEVDFGKLAFGYEEMQNIKITKTEESIDILGYKCRKAIVDMSGDGQNLVDVFYTDDIDLKNSNINNPYQLIDGVLLEFHVILHGIKMKFKATEIQKAEVPDETFDVPLNREKVNLEQMKSIMERFSANKR